MKFNLFVVGVGYSVGVDHSFVDDNGFGLILYYGDCCCVLGDGYW